MIPDRSSVAEMGTRADIRLAESVPAVAVHYKTQADIHEAFLSSGCACDLPALPAIRLCGGAKLALARRGAIDLPQVALLL
jgi:hypothetical protein